MYCRNCGREIEGTARFCPYCGAAADGERANRTAGEATWAYALGYVPFLFWLPLVVEPKTAFGRQVANQGLLLLILGVVVNLLFAMLQKLVGWSLLLLPLSIVVGALSLVAGLGLLALMIIGIIHGASGRLFKLPVIGQFTLIK